MLNALLGLGVVAFSIAGLSIGVLVRGKALTGSCGGLNQDGECEICGK